MDMRIFQVHSNKALPHMGSILIASPLLYNHRFARSVILMIKNSKRGGMGIMMNRNLKLHLSINQLIPEIHSNVYIPLFEGGPVEKNRIFYIHTMGKIKGAFDLGNGLYLNGEFESIRSYILNGNPVQGSIRFFAGYAGWTNYQLQNEINANTWFIGSGNKQLLLESNNQKLWRNCMNKLGNPYKLWAGYPQYPSFN